MGLSTVEHIAEKPSLDYIPCNFVVVGVVGKVFGLLPSLVDSTGVVEMDGRKVVDLGCTPEYLNVKMSPIPGNHEKGESRRRLF